MARRQYLSLREWDFLKPLAFDRRLLAAEQEKKTRKAKKLSPHYSCPNVAQWSTAEGPLKSDAARPIIVQTGLPSIVMAALYPSSVSAPSCHGRRAVSRSRSQPRKIRAGNWAVPKV